MSVSVQSFKVSARISLEVLSNNKALTYKTQHKKKTPMGTLQYEQGLLESTELTLLAKMECALIPVGI